MIRLNFDLEFLYSLMQDPYIGNPASSYASPVVAAPGDLKLMINSGVPF